MRALPRLFWVTAQSFGTRSRVHSLRTLRNAVTAACNRTVPLSRSPSAQNARPKLFWVIAQSSGAPCLSPLLQRLAIGGDRRFQSRRAAFPLPKRQEHIAQIVLGRGPLQRHALAGGQMKEPVVSLDRGKQSIVIAEFVSLLIKGAC